MLHGARRLWRARQITARHRQGFARKTCPRRPSTMRPRRVTAWQSREGVVAATGSKPLHRAIVAHDLRVDRFGRVERKPKFMQSQP